MVAIFVVEAQCNADKHFLLEIFSYTSAKAECDLSNLSCVCMCVDQNKPPSEMAYPLGISWFQAHIYDHHQNLY